MDVQYSLTKMVKTARTALRLSEQLNKIGYPFLLLDEIYGDIADAIYYLIGENTIHFEDSLTFIVLNTDAITDDARITILLKKYLESTQ